MDELNPNHPMTAMAHDHWHKLCAMVMHKMGAEHVVITSEDIQALVAQFAGDGGPAIAIQETKHGLELTLISMERAASLAREQGGLPQ